LSGKSDQVPQQSCLFLLIHLVENTEIMVLASTHTRTGSLHLTQTAEYIQVDLLGSRLI
jgi:hypothetical protein